MKMIIDIPEQWEGCTNRHLRKCISEGTPLTEVLDDIRAEIDEQYDRVHPYDISCAEGLEMALDIIDKYKTEGSNKE